MVRSILYTYNSFAKDPDPRKSAEETYSPLSRERVRATDYGNPLRTRASRDTSRLPVRPLLFRPGLRVFSSQSRHPAIRPRSGVHDRHGFPDHLDKMLFSSRIHRLTTPSSISSERLR